MPYKFTQEEKEEFLRKYQENITTLNNAMPEQYREDHAFKFDRAAFDKNAEDPDKAWMYKKALEIRTREEKKKEIQERLEAEMADLRIPGKVYALERWLHTELIASDDPEAEAYNREMVRMYLLHPEAVVQRRMGKLLESNVEDLAALSACKNKESMMVAWSDKNSADIEAAFEAYGTVSKYEPEVMTPECAKYYGGVLRNYEVMMDASEYAKRVNESYFTVPIVMNQAQDQIINGVYELEESHPELLKALNQNPLVIKTAKDRFSNLTKFFKDAKDKHLDLKGDGALTGLVAKTTKEKEPYMSVGAYLSGAAGADAVMTKLTAEEIASVKQIFKVDHTKEPGFKEPEMPEKFKTPAWQKARDEIVLKYSIKHDKPMYVFDNGGLIAIAEQYRGGLKERIFHTTSHQYNNFLQTMKDFDNEKHVNFHNSMPVKLAANDYLIHKGVKTREEAMALPSPAKERATLCFDVLESFQKAEPVTEDKMVPGTRDIVKAPVKEWPPAIEDKALVEDTMFGDMFEEKEPAPEIEAKEEIQEPQGPEQN